MNRTFRFLIRTSSFLIKEVVELLRQPRLLLTLVLGPFLILLLFGIGYSSSPLPERTLFVIPQDSQLRPYIERYATTFIKQLVFEGIVSDEKLALARLRTGQVDIVIVVPDKIEETLRANKQAVFVIYNEEIDPIRESYVQAFANLFVNEMNRRTLQMAVDDAKSQALSVQPDLEGAIKDAATMQQALQSGDQQQAQVDLKKLEQDVTGIQAAILLGGLVLQEQSQLSGQTAASSGIDSLAALEDILRNLDALQQLTASPGNTQQAITRLAAIQRDLQQIDSTLNEIQGIDSNVLVSPYKGELKTALSTKISLVNFYIPAVIALLLQHLCVTFGALSIVKEQRLGMMELFQASPLSAFEVLLGKYLSYLLFITLLAAILISLLLFGLQMPMLGNWLQFALTIAGLLVAALGIGFIISLISQTTSQAVQYSMLVLLVSVFFSGFFLSLELLKPSVRVLSWTIPATYAIHLLQDIMLRGRTANFVWIGILAGIGLALFVLAWLLLRRAMNRV